MKREIHRIEPWSAVRVGFFLGLFGGFLLGLFYGALFKYLGGAMSAQAWPPEMISLVNLSGGAVIALAIIMSLMASLTIAMSGGIAAVLYNIIARLFGGIEYRVSTHGSPGESDRDEPEAPAEHHEHD